MGSSVAKRTSKTGKKSQKQTEAEIEAAALEQLERITGGTNERLQGYIVEQLINRHGVKLLTLFARQQETLAAGIWLGTCSLVAGILNAASMTP